MNNPLISVIIPTYQRPNEVVRAVESVINQTYKNVEIIVIDDNNDISIRNETYSNLKNILNKHRNIKYFTNKYKNGGCYSRNFGVEVSKGELIAFLDDDDEFFEDKLKRQYEYYTEKLSENRKIGIVYCYSVAVDTNKRRLREYKKDIEGIALKEAMMDCIASTSLWLMSKQVFNEVGGFTDTPSKQDNFFIIKLLEKNYELIRVPENLLYYYEHGNKRISGLGVKCISGFLNIREYSRKIYSKLNEEDRLDIEFEFSRKLIPLYLVNKMNNEAKIELNNMINIRILDIRTIKSIIKYYFRYMYIKFLNLNKYN